MLDIHTYQKQQVEQGIDTPYTVQFLMYGREAIDKQKLLEALQRHIGRVEEMDPESELLAFAYVDHRVRFQEGMMPAQCMFTQAEDLVDPLEAFAPSITQTWDWKGLEEVISKCKSVVSGTDMLAGALNRGVRLHLVHGFIRAFLDVAPVAAIHWLPSQRMVDPQFYREGIQQGHLLITSALNVRMFKVEESDQIVMDTMGLRAFSLPDLQCHFRNADPMRVGLFLYECGDFIFQKGDLIKTGDTIAGFDESQKFAVRRETSMVLPSRLVLDIEPGEYAAPR